MSIKKEFQNLKEQDIWSLLLFTLAQMQSDPNYKPLSELPFILDKNNFLNLCQYFGGVTITIPTLKQLELFISGLTLYKYVELDGLDFNDAISKISCERYSIKDVKEHYSNIKEILDTYTFEERV